MIDWKPIKDVPTIDIYDISSPMPNILLFHPKYNAPWSTKPKEGYILGYAYQSSDDRTIVCAIGWSSQLAAECTHWALLIPPTKMKNKTRSSKTSGLYPSVKEWRKAFKKSKRKVDRERG